MKYHQIKISFLTSVSEQAKEIIIANLAELGCDSFSDEGRQLNGYIPSSDISDSEESIKAYLGTITNTNYLIAPMEDKNWNEEWESNFDPIIVNDECSVRAPFHNEMGYPTELVIMPRMAFGTGHHETTQMMIEAILSIEVQGKKVLDMGCGTGVLAIAALVKGAASADAIDIDEWAYDNVIENGSLNGVKDKITPFWGDAEVLQSGDLKDSTYDIILANINRNILIRDMEIYVNHLAAGGTILFSGFLSEDIPLMCERANSLGLELVSTNSKNRWNMLAFKY